MGRKGCLNVNFKLSKSHSLIFVTKLWFLSKRYNNNQNVHLLNPIILVMTHEKAIKVTDQIIVNIQKSINKKLISFVLCNKNIAFLILLISHPETYA